MKGVHAMKKIWLKNYPPGIPAEINVTEFASLRDVLHRSCARFADMPAFSAMGATLTYAELDRASRNFAAYLQNKLGLHKGDRVAIMLPNLLQYPVALFGVLRAGLVAVNINSQYTAHELEHQLKDSGALTIVILENFANTLQEVLAKNPDMELTVITTEVGDMLPVAMEILTNLMVKYVNKMVPHWDIANTSEFNAALRLGAGQTLHHVALNHSNIAFLQYTSGTTGDPKGVVLTHGNMLANLAQVSAWIAHDLLDGQEVFLCPLPLHQIYALNSALVFMKIGAHTILVPNTRDMHDLIQEFKRYPVTAIIGVNSLYRSLLDWPDFLNVDVHYLKLANAGGMAVQRAVAQRWKEATGIPIVEAYGLTETSPGAICNPLNIKDWTGTVGLPLPSTDVTILDDHDHAMPIGTYGEIAIKGPQVMAGYWMRPDETAKVFTKDGWLRTGDIGVMHENGYITLTDRKKDVIIVSGFNVFPNQVEDVVALHPGVREVAAIGVPDERLGQAVKIIVVRADPSLSAQELLAHCRKKLTAYKVPKSVEFRSAPLPKTNLGKVLRRQLRQAAPSSNALNQLMPL
jgi:long-chain acyl-CoA synthetase